MRVYLLTTFLFSTLGVAQPSPHCLEYQPKTVALEGKLVRETFPGPPNYEDVKTGDTPETYVLLELN